MVESFEELESLLDSESIFRELGITQEQQEDIDFLAMQEYYYGRPTEFMEDFLDLIADEKQKEVAESIRDHKRTAVRSGQGVGKTAIVSGIVIWYLCTRYQAKIIATAPNMNTLNTVLWAEIAKWLEGSPLEMFITHTKTRLYMNGYEKSWFAFPKTANSPEGMAGQHADNMLIIVDEASGVLDEILETLLATISGPDNKILFISNPTRTSGTYYKAFHQDRSLYNCIHINSEECQRVDRENIDMIARSYGKDSNVYRVRVRGEFPKQEDDVFINLELVEQALAREWIHGEVDVIKIGVDVSRFGNDSTVIAPNILGNISKLVERQGNDTTETTGNTIKTAIEEREAYARYVACRKCEHRKQCDAGKLERCVGIKKDKAGNYYYASGEKIKLPIVIAITDDTGVGGGVTDQLRRQKDELELDWFFVYPVNAAEKVSDQRVYDKTTYMYRALREALREGEITLPKDMSGYMQNDIIGQLSSRKYKIMPNGKIQIEPKKDMKSRGLKSPDIADAIALSMYPINIEAFLRAAEDGGRPKSKRDSRSSRRHTGRR